MEGRDGPSKPIVAYIRVSTQQQGESGLGLEAQAAAIIAFANAEGFTIISETFIEVKTGKGADRSDAARSWSPLRPPTAYRCPIGSPSSTA